MQVFEIYTGGQFFPHMLKDLSMIKPENPASPIMSLIKIPGAATGVLGKCGITCVLADAKAVGSINWSSSLIGLSIRCSSLKPVHDPITGEVNQFSLRILQQEARKAFKGQGAIIISLNQGRMFIYKDKKNISALYATLKMSDREKCLPEGLLNAYAREYKTDQTTINRIQSHLDWCQDCQTKVDRIKDRVTVSRRAKRSIAGF
jgi:hypothetical protein